MIVTLHIVSLTLVCACIGQLVLPLRSSTVGVMTDKDVTSSPAPSVKTPAKVDHRLSTDSFRYRDACTDADSCAMS